MKNFMKNIRLRPVHWFSIVVPVFLIIGLIRPHEGITKHPAAPSPAYTAYRIVSNADDQWLEPFSVHLPPKTEPMAGVLHVMTLLKPEDSPLSPGTRVLSVTLKENGVAWADFDRKLVANFPGGSGRESLLLAAILRTLGQFPAVRAVQITVEGKVIESIGGHVDVSEPQPVRLTSSG